MADFSIAQKFVAQWEGGYTNDPTDPGGPTKYGVSLRWLKSLGADGDIDGDGDIDVDDVKALTREQAAALFKQRFWDAYSLGTLTDLVGFVCYDGMVNMGPAQIAKIMQRSYNACSTGDKLAVDGGFGPKTRAALLAMGDSKALLKESLDQRETFYRGLATKKPKVYGPFLKGWLNRTNALRKAIGV